VSGSARRTHLNVGTRGSKLALAQTRLVIARLRELWPDCAFEERIIRTAGDVHAGVSLSQLVDAGEAAGGKGLFTKAIEDRLLAGDVDLAVHSSKDLPTELPEGLQIGAFPEREDARDALVLAAGPIGEREADPELSIVKSGGAIGTGSLRRQAQLRHRRPDLRFVDMRGNLDTRLRKLREQGLDAIVLAAAGLRRLKAAGLPVAFLPLDVCLPAAGQGALAIEVRTADARVAEVVAPLEHPETAAAVRAERAALGALGGGCRVPVGLYGRVDRGALRLRGVIASSDGARIVRTDVSGPMDRPEAVGRDLATELLARGGREIL
jgi:hydroxymethylbilane synthase